MQSDTNITVGMIVEDWDKTSSCGVVVNYPPIPAEDWYVQGRGLLSEDNPDYPADDRTAIVIFEDDLEEHYPEYSGYEGIPMAQLNADDAPYYAFPESRLRRVGELKQPELALEAIDPSPYHARNFDAEANRDYIDAIAERGRPKPLPVVRPLADGEYEILNGHKRIWASHVVGLEEIPVAVLPLDNVRAAQYWAQRHLPGYNQRERAVALNRLHDQLNSMTVGEIRREHCSSDDSPQPIAAKTDGGQQ
ncbi:ParB N-terminal domain-containing protein [Natrinema hispanicum]|uniref:Chromosome partitioning protein, ParB family n=1 Tax=Natrinema hispanicum TaxID=392421 RepID=A0A1I0IWB9_9EURY|nr:ParB N-terminal domain-containing protein [Natrinema hispanicum]SEU00923.1 chromosome partitioning protein, ParB family [Natrinema hispanicum]